MAESAQQALALLRDGSHFQWYVIPLLLLVMYVYANEVEKKNWSLVLAGLAFWLMDWFNEIWNGLVFHFTNFAPVWGTPDNGSALVLLIGLNIEITFMFSIMGIVMCKMLPSDKNLKILGINNRLIFAVVGAILAVGIECLLNWVGALTWEYSWWSLGAPWLIWLIGYLPFFLVSYWVLDMKTMKSKLITVGVIAAVDIISLLVFIPLKWI
ncbi:MAG: hypothetical protein PHY03_02370 [Dehalococcoidia bacterium]|nr:hypothetical protein [Dehalococcoidia bacterium]